MAFPTVPTIDYSYTAFQQAQGKNEFPGTQLDNDLANLADGLAEVRTFIEGSFRSDGGLLPGALPAGTDLDSYGQDLEDIRDQAVAARDEAVAAAASAESATSGKADVATTLAGYGITDAAPLAHVGGAGNAHALATTLAHGFMSSVDKAKLDAMAPTAAVTSVAGRTGVVVLEPLDVGLGNVDNVQQAPLSHVGASGSAHAEATTSVAGFMSAADKIKANNTAKTPYDFGAAGDGTTDDTAALNAWLADTGKYKRLAAGSFRIVDAALDGTAVLTCSVEGVRIWGEGEITAATTVKKAVQISGANSDVQMNIAGNNKIANGIFVTAAGCAVHDCNITGLYSTDYSCVGIYAYGVSAGVVIARNTISTVNSVGDGVVDGTGNGMSRAIGLYMTAPATRRSLIVDNIITDVIGEQGDAIIVLATNGSGTYYDADVDVSRNSIDGFTRRALKVQANRVRIADNTITHRYTLASDVPNAQNVIDLVQGGNHEVTGNRLIGCKFFVQISVYATGSDVFNGFWLKDNIITGLGSETSSTCITFQPGASTPGTGGVISGNWIEAGTGRAISCGQVDQLVIERNTISVADNASERAISLSSSVTKSVVRDNALVSGVRQCFIGFDCTKTVLQGNIVRTETPLFRNSSGGGNSVIEGNVIDGSTAIYSAANSMLGNRFGGNWNLQAQTNLMPAPLLCYHSSGPTVQFAGLYVQVGQIAFDATPTAGSYAGWVATTSGLAESVTWKTFGAIST